MSGNFGFGFAPQDPDDDKNKGDQGFDMSSLGSALEALGRMMQSGESSGPINWDLARQNARQSPAQKDDSGVTDPERAAVVDAVRLANLWLDESESFSATNTAAVSWSRGEWVEGTFPAWERIISPVAEQWQATLGGVMGGEGLAGLTGELPPGLAEGMPEGFPSDMSQFQDMLGPITGMMTQMVGAMLGSQVGQGLGLLSGEVLSVSDIGLSLTSNGEPTLLPRNVNVFADGIGVPRQEVLLYIAIRECAHQRLYSHVPWLRSRLEDAVAAYSKGIHIDTEAMQRAMEQVDPNNPQAMQEALSGGIFEQKDSPEQRAALARLETILALVEGWVDHVVNAAVADRVPTMTQLNEAMRRRRAAGGPAEKTFATLVGLELRPRRMREAAEFWAKSDADRGVSGRDGLWEHPDLLPTAEDLDDLPSYWERDSAMRGLTESLEAELAQAADADAENDVKESSDDEKPDN
ncbi:zinc-dependent metalloprotease [Candidatus Nanopelagicales bacterium]|nr:zinc-dependent metalloprotease [Candidatus Nanopelagicales bacterium]